LIKSRRREERMRLFVRIKEALLFGWVRGGLGA
jgi:hypothetical protein